VFIHCSASDYAATGIDLVDVVRRWHVDQNGWSDIGYHYLIDKKGNVMHGRPLEKTPAAQKGHNTGTIAIMVHGLEEFTEDSMKALRGLCGQINLAYSGRISFHGHCEVSSKACPVFSYRRVLQLDNWQRMS
jgi:hypothetical protein